MWKSMILIVIAVFSSFVKCNEHLIDLGCWKDTSDRAVPSVDGVLEGRYGPYKSRSGAIQRCASYAKSLGFAVFAVQDGGWCATAEDALQTFQKYGPSTACQSDGKGGPWANQVYEIETLPETAYKHDICEGNNRTISCTDENHINVESANYGRTSSSTCQREDIYTTQCFAPFSLDYVSKFCNDQSSCRLEAQNSVYGDPCYGTYRYLHVEYTCKAPEYQVKVVCEGCTGTIKCWLGTKIIIYSAFYGRTDASTCSDGPIHTTSCMNAQASVWVRSQCEKRTSCDVSANNDLFGDPCKTTKKYLNIQYECV